MNFKTFYLTESENTHLGYKIVNYDGKQAYSIADNKVKYSLKKGTIETGKIYLGTSEKYARAYYSTESSDPDDPQELLLVYEINPSDIIQGNLEDKDQLTGGSEIIVRKAKLKSAYNITKKEYIIEMPSINKSNSGWSESPDHWSGIQDRYKLTKLVKEYKIGNTVYQIRQNKSKNILDVYCLSSELLYGNSKIIGVLQLNKLDTDDSIKLKRLKYPKISWVAVRPEYRNKGIASGLYISAIDYFGGLVSDSSLTKRDDGSGSLNVWTSLQKSKYVYAFDGDNFKELDSHDIGSDEYHKSDILFVASENKIKGAIEE